MSSSPETATEKKRKRVEKDDDLAIDINLPEPPSKKAKRKEKKSKTKSVKTDATDGDASLATRIAEDQVHPTRSLQVPVAKGEEAGKRSDYGVWIGNLSFKTTKDSLRRFLLDRGGIDETSITRTNLPVDHNTKQNKGFAYVDFTTEAVLNIALTCSEKLLDGRKVLIKNAKSFEGRPEKTKAEEDAAKHGNISTKAPSKRIFVGNLSFDITKDELYEHFTQAGVVEDVFLATFEDSGKCKGFGWVTFADIESAEKAVKGFVFKDQTGKEDASDEEEDEDIGAKIAAKIAAKEGSDGEEFTDKQKERHLKKKKKPMKWFINRIHGRMMKLEFAEDKQTRYTKRYGKGGSKQQQDTLAGGEKQANTSAEAFGDDSIEGLAAQAAAARDAPREKIKKRDPKLKGLDKDQKQELRRKKHDARLTAPGAALANAQRSDKATGAAVAGTGKKISFD